MNGIGCYLIACSTRVGGSIHFVPIEKIKFSQTRNMPNNRSVRFQRKKNQDKKQKQDPALQLRPAFPGQYCTTIVLPGQTFTGSTTVTTGAIALSIVVDPVADVINWATRFQVTFDEYRVVKAVLNVRLFSSVNPGVINIWVDENTSAAPSSTNAQSIQGSTLFPASSVEKLHTFKWTPHSTDDQDYLPVATSSTVAYFKIFTNTNSYGASPVVTPYLMYQIVYTVQFRGLP